jgi:hypothetical protein
MANKDRLHQAKLLYYQREVTCHLDKTSFGTRHLATAMAALVETIDARLACQ